MIDENKIINVIMAELHRAELIHPEWPTDQVHQVAILAEESGELVKAVLDFQQGKTDKQGIFIEAVQTAAMAIRFIKNMGVENA